MSNEEEKRCPLCAEEMDWTDLQLKPCKCGYEVCVWCWNNIMNMAEKDSTEGRCPACRTPYDKDKIVSVEANVERVAANNLNRKNKPPKAKPKANEGKKDLSNVRVIQRKMAYIIGLPLSLADEDLLKRKEYFGQYGKVTKVSLSRTAGGTIQQFINDSCSVYITFSKEEEAVRCIQSVHGYNLEGRLLRASFGTAKYCHAWLRNMPCTNPSCLYLHAVGADEDSFGKDEVAALHTRNRVQEIAGAAQCVQRGAGSMLPPPIDDFSSYSISNEESMVYGDLKENTNGKIHSTDHLSCSKDKDGVVRPLKQMTSFVDIVARPSSSASQKEGNSYDDGRTFNLCSDISSLHIGKSDHIEVDSDSKLSKSASLSQLGNGNPRSKIFNEPFREPSKAPTLERVETVNNDACITSEQSCLTLESGRRVLHSPCHIVRHESAFDHQWINGSVNLSESSDVIPSSHPSKVSEDDAGRALWHTGSQGLNDYIADPRAVNNCPDDASIQSTCLNSLLDDGYNEKNFESLAKSDRVYRGSNSFSNEEIVEHLRRLDDTMTNDENTAALEDSIISNILSLDFDACDDTTLSHSVGLFDWTKRHNGSSWNLDSSDQSGFSFVKQQDFTGQATDPRSPFDDIGLEFKKYSIQDPTESKEQLLFNPQCNGASRAPGLTPPGFSATNKPPPGFTSSGITEQILSTASGNQLIKPSLSNNIYRAPSAGNFSNSCDDIVDPAILVLGRGKTTNGLNHNSCFDTFSISPYDSQPNNNAFEEEAKLWLLMQQSTNAHQDRKYSQAYLQPTLPSVQEPAYSSGLIGNGFYGGLMDNNLAAMAQYSSQPKYGNGHIPNGYQLHGDEMGQYRTEIGVMPEVQRNERLGGLGNFYQGYGGEYMYQMPTAGDVYTRVFGM